MCSYNMIFIEMLSLKHSDKVNLWMHYLISYFKTVIHTTLKIIKSIRKARASRLETAYSSMIEIMNMNEVTLLSKSVYISKL